MIYIYIYISNKKSTPPPKKSYDFATRKSTLLKQLLLFFPQITLTTTGTGRMGGSVAGPRPSGLALYLSPWSLWSPDGHPWESFSRREFRWVFGWNGLGWDTVGVGGHLKILTFWSLKHFEPQRNGGFWTDDFFLWKLGDVFFFLNLVWFGGRFWFLMIFLVGLNLKLVRGLVRVGRIPKKMFWESRQPTADWGMKQLRRQHTGDKIVSTIFSGDTWDGFLSYLPADVLLGK